ncbi:MAG: hypothetical protein AB8G15_21810 [Saprospiraceae bacterium]
MKKLIFASFLLLMASSLKAQTTVEKQLLGIALLEAADGFSFFHEKYGKLKDNYYQDYSVYMYAGNRYRIHGACDNDCRDLDLTIYDGYGNTIGNDGTYGDLPYTWVNVYSSGYFTVRVSMENCNREPCRYGFAVFRN